MQTFLKNMEYLNKVITEEQPNEIYNGNIVILKLYFLKSMFCNLFYTHLAQQKSHKISSDIGCLIISYYKYI